MCCIFTCCGWMFDLVQRLWVFVMSCCMCSAVCMSVMTASMSGIAMGYNYSLAEYIDMKETNVSVFLKRGIFDDDLGSDMGFRRAGHGPVSGLIKESDLVTADAEEAVIPKGSGRRLDDSVLQSNDNTNFEGSLMRLTAKPPASTEGPSTYRGDDEMGDILKKYPANSLDQLKAIQSLMNMRKNNERRVTIDYDKTTRLDPRNQNPFRLQAERRMMVNPELESPQRSHIYLDKAAIPIEHFEPIRNPGRTAVPSGNMGKSENWMLPKNLEETLGRTLFFTDELVDPEGPFTPHTYPSPIRYKTDVVRPTLTPSAKGKPPTLLGPDGKPKEEMDFRRLDNSEVQIKDKLLMDKALFPSFQKIDSKADNTDNDKSDEVDYEEEAKRGIRVRKKRNINMLTIGVVVEETRYTPPNILFNKYTKADNDRRPDKIRFKDESTTVSYDKNINKSLYSTNDTKNSTIRHRGENHGNVTQAQTSIFAFKNGSFTDDTLRSIHSRNCTIEVMGTKVFNQFNFSLPTTVKVKSDKSVITFLKSLLN